jgi:enoyl-CoA hydratase
MNYEGAKNIDYSNYSALKLNLVNRILTVTLSNPGRKNAVSPQMSEELSRIWDDIWLDDNVSVAILTGDGDSFCSGVDLNTLSTVPREGPPTFVNAITRSARKHVMGIVECEKPIIAKVRGPAYGMGVNMALACDMVFVSESAVLCDSHVKAGMVAGDGGVLLWPLAIGLHRAKEYLMTGEPIPGPVAAQIGLVNRCLSDDALDAHVQETAEKLRDLPPHAVNYTKVSLNVVLKQMTQSAFEASLAYELYSMQTMDFVEAGDAFKAKRRGHFQGR